MTGEANGILGVLWVCTSFLFAEVGEKELGEYIEDGRGGGF